MSNKVEDMMESTLAKLKESVNADTIIGNPITTQDGTVIIPVSKVTYGFAAGGTDIKPPHNVSEPLFGGGNGAGMSIIPVAFLVISNGDVKLLQVESFNSAADRIISMAPDLVDKISKMIKNKKSKNDKQNEK